MNVPFSILWAISTKDIDLVANMLNNGTDPDEKIDGFSPLCRATSSNFIEATEILLSFGANPNCTDVTGGLTPLMHAAFQGNDDIIRRLISAGAKVQSRDEDGLTAFHYAAKGGKAKTIKILLENGSDINAKDLDRREALYWSLSWRNSRTLEELILNGARIDGIYDGDKSPLEISRLMNDESCTAALLAAGAQPRTAKCDPDQISIEDTTSQTSAGGPRLRGYLTASLNRMLKQLR